MPVPPVVTITWAMLACAVTAARTSAGSSRTIWRPTISCPAPSSAAAIAAPLRSDATVRVSLIVRTKQRTLFGASLRCSSVDTPGSDRYGLLEAGEHLAVERRVLLPGGRGDEPSIAHAVRGHVSPARGFGLEAHVFVAGHAFSLEEPGGGHELDAMADGEDPFTGSVELAKDRQDARIVAQVPGRTAADAHQGGVLGDVDVLERQVRLEDVSGHLLVGIPTWLEVVHHQVEPPFRGGG